MTPQFLQFCAINGLVQNLFNKSTPHACGFLITLFWFQPVFDTFPGLLQYISQYISFHLFILSHYTMIYLSLSTRKKKIRITENTSGSSLGKRYRKDLAFQALLYMFFCISPSITKSVHLRGITCDSIFSSQD